MTKQRIEVLHEGTEWEMIEMNGRWAQWTFGSGSKDGSVCIECFTQDEINSLTLTQDELKQVIAFLQKQVKQ